jgi:adenylosuccinate lyase
MAERLMAELTRKGMGRQTAYALVRKCAIKANKEQELLSEVILSQSELEGYLTTEDVQKIMNPRTYIGSAVLSVEKIIKMSENWF